MIVQSAVRKGLLLLALMVGLPLWAGCGVEEVETGPAFEPNTGPQMPAAAGKGEKKSDAKASTKTPPTVEKSEPNK